jgi:hypothetical protein
LPLLAADQTILDRSCPIIGKQQEVKSVIVNDTLDGVTALQHLSFDMVDSQVGDYMFPRPDLSPNHCSSSGQGDLL